MAPHVMQADHAAHILTSLRHAGVEATVGGGWAIDALLGHQTRMHSDLDLWIEAQDLDPLIKTFVQIGVDRLYPWGDDRPWNIVVHDGDRLRVDLHLYEKLSDTRVHYGSIQDGDEFDYACLRGVGTIAGAQVVSETPEWALLCHTGYPPRSIDREDVKLLCARFVLPLPDDFR